MNDGNFQIVFSVHANSLNGANSPPVIFHGLNWQIWIKSEYSKAKHEFDLILGIKCTNPENTVWSCLASSIISILSFSGDEDFIFSQKCHLFTNQHHSSEGQTFQADLYTRIRAPQSVFRGTDGCVKLKASIEAEPPFRNFGQILGNVLAVLPVKLFGQDSVTQQFSVNSEILPVFGFAPYSAQQQPIQLPIDITFEDFHALLSELNGVDALNEYNVESILRLVDYFQLYNVVGNVANIVGKFVDFLANTDNMTPAFIYRLAVQYNFRVLQVYILQKLQLKYFSCIYFDENVTNCLKLYNINPDAFTLFMKQHRKIVEEAGSTIDKICP